MEGRHESGHGAGGTFAKQAWNGAGVLGRRAWPRCGMEQGRQLGGRRAWRTAGMEQGACKALRVEARAQGSQAPAHPCSCARRERERERHTHMQTPFLALQYLPRPALPCAPSFLAALHLRLVLQVQDALLLLRNRLVPPCHVPLQRRHVALQPLDRHRQLALLGLGGPARYMPGRVGTRGLSKP